MSDRLSLSDLARLQELGDGFAPHVPHSPARPIHFSPEGGGAGSSDRLFPDPDGDPLRDAWADGHAAGLAQGADVAVTRCAADLAEQLRALAVGREEGLAERLHVTVVALARQLLAEAPFDEAALERRIARALALLGDTPPLRCRCHPDAVATARSLLPGVMVEPDPSLAPNEVRLATEAGGLADGPEEWAAALTDALARC